MMTPQRQHGSGFTIVELLIVIVVIGILAAVTIVAYNGIQQRAVQASIQSGVRQAGQLIGQAQTLEGQYPADITTLGIRDEAGGTNYIYEFDNTTSPRTFCITGYRSDIAYHISEEGTVREGVCPGHTLPDENAIDYTFTTLDWQVLTNRPETSAPTSFATNGDGSIVYLAYSGGGSGGYLYRSTDSGENWTRLDAAGFRRWSAISVSSNGQKVIAATDGLTTTPDRFVSLSLDGGATWQDQVGLFESNWRTVHVSYDGSTFAAGFEVGQVHISEDDGANWRIMLDSTGKRWGGLASSNNGQTVYAVARCAAGSGAAFLYSLDAGVSSTASVNPSCASDVATSANGQTTLVIGSNVGSGLTLTTNGGATWTDISSRVTSRGSIVDVSQDGTKMIIEGVSSQVHISKDTGVTWQTYSTGLVSGTTAARDARNVIVSGDGGVYYSYTLNALYRGQFD
jgi:prepilin-type N-terminal cleavage/methylation domain-containing protein